MLYVKNIHCLIHERYQLHPWLPCWPRGFLMVPTCCVKDSLLWCVDGRWLPSCWVADWHREKMLVAGKPHGEKMSVAVAYWWIATWILMLAWFCCFMMCFFLGGWFVSFYGYGPMAIKFAWSMRASSAEDLEKVLVDYGGSLYLPGNPCAWQGIFFFLIRQYAACMFQHCRWCGFVMLLGTCLMLTICVDYRTWPHVVLDVRCHGRWHWEGYIIAHPSSSPDSKVLMFFLVLIAYWLIVLAENNWYVQNI